MSRFEVWERGVSACVASLAVVCMSACGPMTSDPSDSESATVATDGKVAARISEAFDAGTDRLIIQVGCGSGLEAEVVHETAISVQVTARRVRSDGGPQPACLDLIAVSLLSPLGDRSLIDAGTGDQITVRDVAELPAATV